MKLYLVRHGEAVSERVDPSRPLSASGRTEIQRVARWLAEAEISVLEIRHSDKTRAAESARIIAEQINPARGTREVSGLSPNDDFARVAEDLQHESDDLMLVGHLPFMGLLGEALLKNNPDVARVSFPTGGLIALERTDAGWALKQVVDPRRLS